MSLRRRLTSATPSVWVPARPSGVMLFTTMLGSWGAAQAVFWAFGVGALSDSLVLDGLGMRAGEYWRLLTFQLLHANFAHLVANIIVLCFVGREIEPIIGRRHFLGLCLVANFFGGIACWLALPKLMVFGASAAAASVLTAYAVILPEMGALLFGQSVCLRAKHIAWALAVLALVGTAVGIGGIYGAPGVFAGCVIGWAWARGLGFGEPFQFQRRRIEKRNTEVRWLHMSAEEFVSVEIDPILEKISRDGIASLTREQRRILELGHKKLVAKKAD